jgi:hypothetical protein
LTTSAPASRDQCLERHDTPPPVGQRRRASAEHGLQLVGGKRRDRWQPGRKQRRQRDHAATPGNGIDETGQHANGGKREKNEGIEHGVQQVQGALWRVVGSSAMRRS